MANHSDMGGDVVIRAIDDTGRDFGPVTLTLEAGGTTHINSTDLEDGNPAKGLAGRIGAPHQGDWRLELGSDLRIDALAYIRTSDGFVTAMHDVAPALAEGANAYRIATFNPGSNYRQESRLRLVNLGDDRASVSIGGVDDQGRSAGPVRLEVAAGASRTVSALALEEGGSGLDGALGDGAGKWQLEVHSDVPLLAMSLLATPTGHVTNLSTVPGPVADGEVKALPFFPAAGNAQGWQGFMRVSNHSETSGDVVIRAIDDAGRDFGTVRLSLDAGQTTHLNSSDLEDGNPAKGLAGRIGAPGQGDWRLELSSDLRVEALAYIRTSDGFVTAMHDLAPVTEEGANAYRVATFNPGSNYRQESRLRLVNPGDAEASVSIRGVDDRARSAGPVRLKIAAWASRTVSALELEEGGGDLDGALGDGTGKWRLEVESNVPLRAMSLLASPTGHLTNLSTVPGAATRFDAGLPADGVHQVGDDLRIGDSPPEYMSAGGFSFGTGRPTEIELDHRDFFDLDDIRYTCQSPGGCLTRDGEIVQGSILKTTLGGGRDDHGDSRASATPVAAGSNPRGVLDTADIDWFRVEIDQPGVLEAYTSGPVDTEGRLESESGALVRENDDVSDFDSNFRISTRVSAGTHYVGVRGWDPSDTGRYTLHVRFAEDRAFSLYDANVGNGDATGIAFAAGRFHVLDGADDKVYAYAASGRRNPSADFDLQEGNSVPEDIAWAARRYRVIDAFDLKVYAYTASGQHDPAADFDLADDNGDPAGIAFADGRLHVIDWTDDKVYAYTPSGERALAADFDLAEENGNPNGIAFNDGRFHVVDALDDKVYAYTASGQRDPTADFDLAEENRNPNGITFANGQLRLADNWADRVYAYSPSGQPDPTADFDLPDGNGDPRGMAYVNGRLHVVDSADKKVFAYAPSGQRVPAADFDLADDNTRANGVAIADGRFHVVDFFDRKVYAYAASGQRDPAADFDLADGNDNPWGIAFATGRFHVLDLADMKVYAYTAAGQRDPTADFDLDDIHLIPTTIGYADGRFHIADFIRGALFAYTESGQYRGAIFEWDWARYGFLFATGIAYSDGRIYLADVVDDTVYSFAVPATDTDSFGATGAKPPGGGVVSATPVPVDGITTKSIRKGTKPRWERGSS